MRIDRSNSFLRPLKRGPWRPMQVMGRRYAPWLAIALGCVIPAFFFWVAYDSVGIRPWDYGFVRAPAIATDTLSRGELLVGLGWAFLVMPALLAFMEIVGMVLARRDVEFTSAGLLCCMLVIAVPTTWVMADTMGNISATGYAIRAHYTEYKLTREILVLKGETEKVRVLDASFVQDARDKLSR